LITKALQLTNIGGASCSLARKRQIRIGEVET
jgi:hypothetical protein